MTELIDPKRLTLVVTDTPTSHDSKDIRWQVDGEGETVGYGYQGKKDGKNHVVRCPRCDTENYALARGEGSCYACGFNPNKKYE